MCYTFFMQNYVAYFSAEWGLSDKLPIYAGGLGILAADILKQANDSNLPFAGIGLFYHDGFFRQRIDTNGDQIEENFTITPQSAGLEEVIDPATGKPLFIEIGFPKEPAAVKVWKKQIGNTPLFLLDTQIPINKDFEQEYTAHLYEGKWSPFIEQEILLGVGGTRLLRTLNLPISKYHINDDHAAFCILERLREYLEKGLSFNESCTCIKKETVFTTHTPVAAAESKYPVDFILPYLQTLFQKHLANKKVTREALLAMGGLDLPNRENFSLSVLALNLAGKINAVSARHQTTSKKIWQMPIDYITNAVHAPTWIAKPMDNYYQKYLGKNYQKEIDSPNLWQKLEDEEGLKQINQDLWHARLECKKTLLSYLINHPSIPPTTYHPPAGGPPTSLFLGFARRFAPYKRAYLLTSDLDRLAKILTNPQKPVYLFIAGKAHPTDPVGKKYLKNIFEAAHNPRLQNHLIFLEDYNINLAKILISGVDVWLNTPLPPMEASGTSGMKAVLNGVLHASCADGWWYEAGNNEIGWVIGSPDQTDDKQTANSLYELLENKIIPLYYQQENGVPTAWLEKVKKSLSVLAPQFNTARLLKEYQEKLYS